MRGSRPARAGASQRQLRVGELLRAALADTLARARFRDPILAEARITVTEVRPAPDLRSARVYVMPLGGEGADALLEALRRAAGYLRGEVSRRVELKHAPSLEFELDATFDHVGHIDSLLSGPTDER